MDSATPAGKDEIGSAENRPAVSGSIDIADLLKRVNALIDERRAAGNPEGLDASDAAAFIGVSRSKWYYLVTSGYAPSPAKLGDGNCARWPATELRAWLLAGAPNRVKWESIRASAMRR